jgi:hypothetical protein
LARFIFYQSEHGENKMDNDTTAAAASTSSIQAGSGEDSVNSSGAGIAAADSISASSGATVTGSIANVPSALLGMNVKETHVKQWNLLASFEREVSVLTQDVRDSVLVKDIEAEIAKLKTLLLDSFKKL